MRAIAELTELCSALEPEALLYKQPHKLSKLLTALREGCDINTAMRLIGSTYKTFYDWRTWANERRPEWTGIVAVIEEAVASADRQLIDSVTRHTKDDGHLGLKVIKSKPSLKDDWGERPHETDERVVINIGVVVGALQGRPVAGLVVDAPLTLEDHKD